MAAGTPQYTAVWQQYFLDLFLAQSVAQARADVHGQFLVVAEGDQGRQRDDRAAAPVEPGPVQISPHAYRVMRSWKSGVKGVVPAAARST